MPANVHEHLQKTDQGLTHSFAIHQPRDLRQGACLFFYTRETVKLLTIPGPNKSDGGSLRILSTGEKTRKYRECYLLDSIIVVASLFISKTLAFLFNTP